MSEYIDREAVISRLEKVDMDTYYGFTAAVQIGVDHAIQCIKEAPAADVAPVRHAHWIDHYSGGSFCSYCKRWVPYNHHPKYCETCGALMDGKEVEHEAD